MNIYGYILSHFKKPEGFFGRIAGKFMEHGNLTINIKTLEQLNIQPDDDILEIGFASGKTIKNIFDLNMVNTISGLDISETMVHQAKIKFKDEIESGKVKIKLGAIEEIPFDDGSFSKIFTVNTLYFWSDPDKSINEVLKVLKPNGKFIVAYRSKKFIDNMKLEKHGFTGYDAADLESLFNKSKFKHCESIFFKDKNIETVITIAHK